MHGISLHRYATVSNMLYPTNTTSLRSSILSQVSQLKWRLGEVTCWIVSLPQAMHHKLSLSVPWSACIHHHCNLCQGLGEAIYELGVDDDGSVRGLTEEDLAKSIDTLGRMAAELGWLHHMHNQ